MRCLVRNKRRFYYANYEGNVPLVDEFGNETGEYQIKYTSPIECYANISPAKGDTENGYFGNLSDYDKVIVLGNEIPITEHSVLWIDSDVNQPYDYVVKRVARSLNNTMLAIKKKE